MVWLVLVEFLRDYNEKLICVFFIPVRIRDSNEAELITMVKMLELTFSRENMFGKSTMVESNSANMVYCMFTLGNKPWYYQELFILTSEFSYAFSIINFTNTRRETNHMANQLAKKKKRVLRICKFVAWM
jgi:hypothetical protein